MAGIQDIVNSWLSQGDVQNKGTPGANEYGATRQNILGNFLNSNQYNTGDSLSSNYQWMTPVAPALGILNSIAPNIASQKSNPFANLMSSMGSGGNSGGAGSTGNLRQDLLLANMQRQAATPQDTAPAQAAPAQAAPAPAPVMRPTTNSDLQSILAQTPQTADNALKIKFLRNAINFPAGLFDPNSPLFAGSMAQYGIPSTMPA